MKRLLRHTFACLSAATSLFLSGVSPAQTLNPQHLNEQFLTLSGYLDQEEFDNGLVLIDLILEAFGPTALEEVGPSFGRFYYLKGLFLLATERYQDAADQFRICHTHFANRGTLAAENPNPLIDEALVRHISCLMALERYEETLPLFGQVNPARLENINDVWAWSLNRGLSMIRAGRAPEGVAHLNSILENTENPNITPAMRMEVIQLLAFHWADIASLEELRGFVRTALPFFVAAPASHRRRANPTFLVAARNAFDRGDPASCLLWLGLFDFVEAVADAEATPAENATLSPSEDVLTSYLSLTAALYIQLENPLAAIPAFEALTVRYPEQADAPEHLANLALSRISSGLLPEALGIAQSFPDTYPDSPRVPEMESALLQVLLLMNDFDALIVNARKILDGETTESSREMATYLLGIALYQQERIEEADTVFDTYAGAFPSGENRAQVLYYRAVAKFQLGKFDEAAQGLEEFVAAYPDGDLTSAALLLQAQVFMQSGENDQALARLEKIARVYATSPEAAAADLLAAELTAESGGSYEEVRLAYENSLRTASGFKDQRSVSNALKALVLLAAEQRDLPRVMEYNQRFFAEVPYRDVDALEVIDSTWRLLIENGRTAETLDRIQTLLLEAGESRTSPVLAPLVTTYREALEQSSVGDAPLVALSEAEETPVPLRAALIMDRIESAGTDNQATKDELYTRLAQAFPKEQLGSDVLAKLARWHQSRGEADTASNLRAYLLETRGGESGFEYVLFDEALLQADSEQPDERLAALQNFEQVVALTEEPGLLERSRLGIARIYSKNEQWSLAEQAWGQYLAKRDWVLARAEANFEFARSIEEGGDPRKALGYYVSIYSNFEKQIEWSAPAYLRAALIMDAQGKRREALLILQDMMRRMHQIDHPVVDRAKQKFNQWRNEFTQSQ